MQPINHLTQTVLQAAAKPSAPKSGAASTADPWIDELIAKLHALYGQKWTNHVAGIPYDALRQTWAEALDGWTKAQAKAALDVVTRTMKWPPSVPDFVQALDDGSTAEQRAMAARLREADSDQRALPAETWAETKARGASRIAELRQLLKSGAA